MRVARPKNFGPISKKSWRGLNYLDGAAKILQNRGMKNTQPIQDKKIFVPAPGKIKVRKVLPSCLTVTRVKPSGKLYNRRDGWGRE